MMTTNKKERRTTMKSVLKKHIVSEVAEDTGYSKVSVSKIFDAITDEIMFQVSNGRKVRIKGKA